MNERIRELADKALTEFMVKNEYAMVLVPHELSQKFAELIVKECMEQVWYDREAIVTDRISESIKERICQHFGVEE